MVLFSCICVLLNKGLAKFKGLGLLSQWYLSLMHNVPSGLAVTGSECIIAVWVRSVTGEFPG